MANWQGLLTIVGINHPALLGPLSPATILYAAMAWKDLDRGFATAILASMLVSYHLTPQDLSLLLIPFYLSIKTSILPESRLSSFALASIGGTLAMVVVQIPLAFLALPLALALGWIGTEPVQHTATAKTSESCMLSSV